MIGRWRDEAVAWCRGRSWHFRAPFLVWFAYILSRHLADPTYYRSLFGALNLGIHELGHFAFAPLGQWMAVAGGSLLQCLAPVVSMVMFRRQRDWFAIAVCSGWLSTNLFEVATYAADARAQELPLVSPGGGGDILHDWFFLLDSLGMLEQDQAIAFLLRAAATVAMLAALAGGGWICWMMARPEPD